MAQDNWLDKKLIWPQGLMSDGMMRWTGMVIAAEAASL
jgi:hypothetical protein